jgi:hypothetical protein
MDGLSASGSTDINRALLEAAAIADRQRPTYLIFLTDGLPTQGVVDSQAILDHFDRSAPPNLRLFTHVLPDPAVIAAQTDTISVNIGALQNRDIFIQVTFVPLPASMPSGVYNVSIGAYDSYIIVRMGVLDDGVQRGTRLFAGHITVTHE